MRAEELPVSPGVRKVLREAEKLRRSKNHPRLGVYHVAFILVRDFPGLVAEVIAGADPQEMLKSLEQTLHQGDFGPPLDPEQILQDVRRYAAERGQKQAFERDLVTAIGQYIPPEVTRGPAPAHPPTPQRGPSPRRVLQSTPRSPLAEFGYNLTEAAARGELRPVVGRDEEIQTVLQVLCRKIKRNPALIGPAGVGKTAIVEGLAQRIVRGEVPPPLRETPVWSVQMTALMAGVQYGQFYERVRDLLKDAAEQKVILFIDEAHLLMNVGFSRTETLANLLKPALARGDLACIIATTDEEYRRFIQPDKALERRFQPVYVGEPDDRQTLRILRSFAESMGWTVEDDILRQIVDWAGRWIRHRYFPDKALDVLDQSMAVAQMRAQSGLTRAIVEEVVYRILQVPPDWSDRLARLESCLQPRVFLDPAGLRSLAERLRFTIPGYDVRAHRPNAVVLVLGPPGFEDGSLGRELARCLYGTPDRVIEIDLSDFTDDHHINRLLGAPPAYVGYGERVPLHDLLFQPWSVLVFKNVDRCHPSIRATIAAAIETGYFTDARGNRLFIGDTVLILTVFDESAASRPIGFVPAPPAKAAPAADLSHRLGPLLESIDITVRAGLPDEAALKQWLETRLLGDLRQRLARQGIRLTWDPDLVEWLVQTRPASPTPRDWERILEERVWPHVVPALARPDTRGRTVRLQVRQGQVQVRVEKEGPSAPPDPQEPQNPKHPLPKEEDDAVQD